MYIYKKYKFIENLNKQYPFPSYFYGKTIVITGANSGLGEALSFLSAKYGAKVVMSGRNMENLEKARQKIIANLPDLIFVPTLCILDVSDPKSIFNFTQEFVRIFDESSPDILINNAGISYRGEISNTEISVHRLLMETNYFGPLQLIKGFLPYMIEKRYGVIVNICSLQGKLAIPFRSAYSASKHALQAYTDCLRAELSKYNIFISLVNPGYINTKLSFNAITYDGALYNKVDSTTTKGMDPLKVADTILRGLSGNRRRTEMNIFEPKYRFAIILRAVLPFLYFDIICRRAQNPPPFNFCHP